MENKIQTNKTVFAIILAAGYSSRMGAFKPLLPMGEKTAVERIIETLEHAKIGKIVVVAGYQKERIHHCLAGKNVVIADNDDFDKGMFSSIQRGMEEGMKGAGNQGESMEYTGFFLNLVDSPLTPVWVLEKILQEHEKNRDVMIVPCYKGKKGHPLFIPSKYFAEILKYDGSGGLKAITNRYDHELRRIEVDSEEVVLDMDTPEAYEELKAYDRHKEEEASCGELLKKFGIKRLVLIRHGQPRQHEGKILLGQTDLPLSQKGRKEAVDAGEELWKLKVNGNRIYTSDLKRAHETAEAIGEVFAKHEERGADSQTLLIAQTPAFREMNLGVWDGKSIKEIKENWPEEFEKRGNHLLTYKKGMDSENFYDLQYRVLKGFKKIIPLHQGTDLVIVAHGGVMKVLLANLENVPLEQAVKKKIQTGEMIVKNI